METTITSGQLAQQLRLFVEKQMTPERWNQILSSGFLADLCDAGACLNDREAFQTALGLISKRKAGEWQLSIDYAHSVAEAVAAGKFDFVHPTLQSNVLQDVHFPINGSGSQTWEACLIFSNGLTPDVMEGAIHSSGWAPAKIEHLLAFGAQHPKEQFKYDVLALGSVTTFEGDKCVAGLTARGPERGLTLYRTAGPYGRGTRYLKVRRRDT